MAQLGGEIGGGSIVRSAASPLDPLHRTRDFGGPETAHQIVNPSDAELRHLAVSTKISPELAEYPDSGKFGVLGEGFRYVGKAEGTPDYYEGND